MKKLFDTLDVWACLVLRLLSLSTHGPEGQLLITGVICNTAHIAPSELAANTPDKL